jgi:RES domain-containing protein
MPLRRRSELVRPKRFWQGFFTASLLKARQELYAYRIADRRYPIFDGGGASEHGARWNSRGHNVIYAAESLALALLEKLRNANNIMIPEHQVFIEIVVPADVLIKEVTANQCPGWDTEDQRASRAYGDRWLTTKGETAVILVPSVVVPSEHNVVINQGHDDCSRIRHSDPQPVLWDKRLLDLLRGKSL